MVFFIRCSMTHCLGHRTTTEATKQVQASQLLWATLHRAHTAHQLQGSLLPVSGQKCEAPAGDGKDNLPSPLPQPTAIRRPLRDCGLRAGWGKGGFCHTPLGSVCTHSYPHPTRAPARGEGGSGCWTGTGTGSRGQAGPGHQRSEGQQWTQWG